MKIARLYRLADELNDDGEFTLEPFDDERFNVPFAYDGSDTFDQLEALVEQLLYVQFDGKGHHFYIDNDRHAGSCFFDEHGNIVFGDAQGDEITTIKNLVPYIATDSPETEFVVLFNSDYSAHYWVAIVPDGE